MGFPEQLRNARKAVGYTQQQVADAMGITNSTYCGYETGKRQPDVKKIKQLADILQTSGDILLETGFDAEEEGYSIEKQNEVIALFESLQPEFQECALEQIRRLAELQRRAL